MENLTATQFKRLQNIMTMAHHDLDYVMHPVAVELRKAGAPKKAVAVLRTAAQRAFYLTATDVANSFGIEIPEYANATGKVRAFVDAQAVTFAKHLAT